MSVEKGALSLWWRVVKQRLRVGALSLLGPKAKYVYVQSGDMGYLVDPADNHVSRQLLKTGFYNSEELGRYANLIKKRDRVLVVGGHIGSIALPFAKLCRHVSIIEANPETFEVLNLNLRLNQLENVSLFQFAAGSANGHVDFVMSSENSGGSKIFPRDRAQHYLYDNPELTTVDLRRIDDMFSEKFDVVLMDIEGSEYAAIAGAKETLRFARVFICEYFPNHLRDIAGANAEEFAALVEDLGFDLVEFPKLRWSGCGKADLVQRFLEVDRLGSTEDGIIFQRVTDG